MANEYERNVGKREMLKRQRVRQQATVEALRDKLRDLLPVVEDVQTIDGNAVLDVAASFQMEKADLDNINRQLAVVNRELGESR